MYNDSQLLLRVSIVVLALCTLTAISLDPALGVITWLIDIELYKYVRYTSAVVQCQNPLAGMITSCEIEMFDEYFELITTSFSGKRYKHTIRYDSVKAVSESDKTISIRGKVPYGLYDIEIPKCFDDMQVLLNKIRPYAVGF